MSIRILTSLALVATLVACGDSFQVSLSSSGASAATDGYEVTSGGYSAVPGEPTTFFGTVAVRGSRRYNYLVIARDLIPATGPCEHSSDGRSTAERGALSTEDDLIVDDVRLTASFSATIGRGRLEDAATTVCGEPVAEGQWLFLMDGADPDAGLIPVDAPMPDLPEEAAALDAFTTELVSELRRSNEAVRAFLSAR